MSKTIVTRWFIEPRDASTNENAIMDLVHLCNATDDKIYYGKRDKEGDEHNVVEVSRSFVARMECDAAKFKHRFRVFTQRNGESGMRLWPFGRQKKLSRTAEVKRIKNELAKRNPSKT